MVRKSSEPNEVKIKRKRPTDKGLEVDLLIRWNIQEKQEEDMDGNTVTFYEYNEEKISVTYNGDESKLEDWIDKNSKRFKLWGWAKGNDLPTGLLDPYLDPSETIYATISDIDATRSDKKYIEVEKTVNNETVNAWAYVTYSMLLAHQNDELSNGDLVIVDFAEGDLDKPVVIDKVVGF